ncbi:MAG: DUF4276 family protein [Chloroflexi bacterium]|nr:DUF4276 family protein [Chloroflexota bacterium]
MEAVPVLLRRLQHEAQTFNLQIGKPIRRSRSELISVAKIEISVRYALLRPGCAAILILFDSDNDCPKEIAPAIEAKAQELAGPIPCAVVMANREYEAWFLGTLESLRGQRSVRMNATSLSEPEVLRGAKERLQAYMDHSYLETLDQTAMTAAFDMAAAYRRCRSFRKMVKAFGKLAQVAGASIIEWPPSSWQTA